VVIFVLLASVVLALAKHPFYPLVGEAIVGVLVFRVGSVLLPRILFDPNKDRTRANGNGSPKAGSSRPAVTWKIGQTEAIEWVQLVAKRQAFYISMESGQGGTTWGSTDEFDRIWAIRGSQSETDFRKKNTDGTGWDCVPDVEEAQTVWLPVGQKP